MTKQRKRNFITLLIANISITAYSCSTPVFQYALERWSPAPYNAIIVKDTALTGKERNALTKLNNASGLNGGNLNIIVRQFNSAKLAKSKFAAAITENKPAKNARLYLFYPESMDITNYFWSGTLSVENVKKIINSPFRKKLAEYLLKGNAGVFVVLESENSASNKVVEAFIGKELKKLEKETVHIEKDTAEENEEQYPAAAIPVKVTYKTIRLPAKGTDDILVSSLIMIDSELQKSAPGIMVFAVYGQGRALPPMTGKTITEENIGYITSFLTGSCSCEVKDMNPGFDLLMNVNWYAPYSKE